MKVLEFAFDSRDSGSANDYLPHNYIENCVAYTGTHDNDTLASWYKGLDKPTKKHIREYINDTTTPDAEMNWVFIRLAMMSCADTCIIPIQDYLELGNEARLNFPSTLGSNWKWRLAGNELTKKLAKRIAKLTEISYRMKKVPKKKMEDEKEATAEIEKDEVKEA